MANVKIRRGAGAPTIGDLVNHYELGWDTTDKYLYINDGGSAMKVQVGFSDLAGAIDTNSGPIDADNIFLKNGVSQVVTVPTTTFDNNVVITGILTATASAAKYSDIAEKYETDRDYETGIILMHGVDTEGTIADGTRAILGVISTNPAYLMNVDIDAKHYAEVVLAGRVPLKVTGPVNKGDYIILDVDNPGFGKAGEYDDYNTQIYIGVALTDDNNGEIEIKI